MTTNTDKMHPQFWLHAEAGYGEQDVAELENAGICPGDVGDISITLMDHNRNYYGDDGYRTDESLGWVNWSDVTLSENQDAVIFSLAVDNNESRDADFVVKIVRNEDGSLTIDLDGFDASMTINKRPL